MRNVLGGLAVAVLVSGVARAEVRMAEGPSRSGGYSFQSTVAIGGAEADDDAFFYEKFGPISVDADAAGHVYVLDPGNVRIQVFDSSGNLLRSLGAEGEGPGEFQIMARMSVNGSGAVAVSDMGLGRVSILDTHGELVRDQVTGGMIDDIVLCDDGTLLLGYGKIGPASVEAYGPDGTRLWSAGAGETMKGGKMVNIQLDRQTVAPRLEILGDGRSFRAPQGTYVVQAFGADGSDAAAFARAFDRRKITEEEMFPPPADGEEDSGPQIVMIKRSHGGSGGGSAVATSEDAGWKDEQGESMTIDSDRMRKYMPEFHPDTRGILAWPDGRIWVVTAHDERKGMVTDEWSADGEYLRRFEIPREYEWLRVGSDGSLYGVSHDDDDYPSAHRIEVKTGA
jgi:hypothetical protein